MREDLLWSSRIFYSNKLYVEQSAFESFFRELYPALVNYAGRILNDRNAGEEVVDRVQFCALPSALYQAYQTLLEFLPEAIEEVVHSNSPKNGIFNFTNEEAEA